MTCIYASHIYRIIQAQPDVFALIQDADMHDPNKKFWACFFYVKTINYYGGHEYAFIY